MDGFEVPLASIAFRFTCRLGCTSGRRGRSEFPGRSRPCYARGMETDISIDISDVSRYAAVLERANRAGPVAMSALLNNMAFGARHVALNYIPKVMHIRNPGFIRASILVRKANPHTLTATFYSHPRTRFSALVEQEFGGTMSRHPATKAARGGTEAGKIRPAARLTGTIIKPEDVQIAHSTGSAEQFMAVYLAQLQRGSAKKGLGTGNIGQRFIVHTSGKWIYPGLKKLWKLKPASKVKRVSGRTPGALRGKNRHGYINIVNINQREGDRFIQGLQAFDTKDKAKVEKRPWMWVSVQKYLSHVRLDVTWERTLNHLMRQVGARAA
jgi:hypothetical protein